MTFLGGTAAYLWGLVQTWTGRANNAWGSSRVWNSGTSWESAYNSEVTAATDPGSSADSWTDHLSRLWSATANLWHGAYNGEVTSFNNLQAGLNNPDGLTTVAMSWATLPDNGASATTFTLTIPRSGHYLIAVVVDAVCSLNSFGDGIDFTCAGIIAQTKSSTSGWNNSGTMSIGAGFEAHGDYTSGQTLTVSITTHFIVGASSSASGSINAHFVPDATHHN